MHLATIHHDRPQISHSLVSLHRHRLKLLCQMRFVYLDQHDEDGYF